MKGTLYKTEKGWVIEYIDNHLERNFISLHPSDHITNKTQRVDGKEVEFEIVGIDIGSGISKAFAKLVEDVPKLGYDERKQNLIDIMNYDAKDGLYDVREIVEDDVEKLELNYYRELEERREVAKNFKGQVAGRHPDMFGHSEMHHMVRGYVEGYNKAKETLYTDEDMWQIFVRGMGVVKLEEQGAISSKEVFDKFIQLLKQPKKD